MTDAFVESSGDPNADRRFVYACDLAARGDVEAAIDLLEQTVALADNFTSAWFRLGELCASTGNHARAIAAFRRAAQSDPADRRGAALHLIRLGDVGDLGDVGGAAAQSLPPEMPPSYVKALFDQFAPRFDDTLVNRLDYRAPALLRAAVGEACRNVARPLTFARAFDLGCGTGLGAQAFCDIARVIDGVDLSPGMLIRARATGLYAELIEADMLAAAQGAPQGAYDLVLAVDAVIYLADLAPLCAEAARILGPQGLFAFTVETHDGEGVILGEKLRYAHAETYVVQALQDAGLRVVQVGAASARHDGGVPVPGLVIVAQKP